MTIDQVRQMAAGLLNNGGTYADAQAYKNAWLAWRAQNPQVDLQSGGGPLHYNNVSAYIQRSNPNAWATAERAALDALRNADIPQGDMVGTNPTVDFGGGIGGQGGVETDRIGGTLPDRGGDSTDSTRPDGIPRDPNDQRGVLLGINPLIDHFDMNRPQQDRTNDGIPNDPNRGQTGIGADFDPDLLRAATDRLLNRPFNRPTFGDGPSIVGTNPNGIPIDGGTGGVNGGGLPIGELPGPIQGGQYASYMYNRGPNGEFLPMQTRQGGSPYQMGGAVIPGSPGAPTGDQFGVQQPQFNPNLPQPQWFTLPPLQPQPLGNPVENTGGTGGNGGPIGGNGGINGGHNTMPPSAPGLLGMPTMNPSTGLLLGGSQLPPSLTGLLR